jgi:hypothetical protein
MPPPWWPDWRVPRNSLPQLLPEGCARWARAADPFQRGQFQRLLGFPGTPAMDQLSFVEPIDRLG